MSLVFPFRALRPAKPYAAQVSAPPYDVMSAEEAKAFVQGNPLSFLHVEKSEIDIPDAEGVDDQRIYDRAKANLQALMERRILLRDEAPRYYLYRQRMGRRTQSGIVACVSIAEYEGGGIKRHEWTRPDKEKERTRHIDTVGAQTGPVFLIYPDREEIDRLMERIAGGQPEYDFTAGDGVRHTVWIIDRPEDIQNVEEGFVPVQSLYIADGHHRAAAAAAVARLRRDRLCPERDGGGQERMMAVLFPQQQLKIMDYNRAVRDLSGQTVEAFIQKAAEKFHVSEENADKAPRRRHDFGMYLAGRWRLLTARKEILRDADPVARLDASLLQEHLLGPVLGIRDQRTDSRISFVGGIRGMAELETMVDRQGYAVAFSLYPPTIEEMMAVADAGSVMPPKSTWFEPKLLSGLFVHLLE
jgi:uncharacterized protein (DUF1015 family)